MHDFSYSTSFLGMHKGTIPPSNLSGCKSHLRGSHSVHSRPLSLQWFTIPTDIPGTKCRFRSRSPSPPLKFFFWSHCQQLMTSTVPQTVSSTQVRGTTRRDGDFRKGSNLLNQLCRSKHYNFIPPIPCFWALLFLILLNPSLLENKPK